MHLPSNRTTQGGAGHYRTGLIGVASLYADDAVSKFEVAISLSVWLSGSIEPSNQGPSVPKIIHMTELI